MDNAIRIHGKQYKKYDDTYYVSAYGDVYSMFCHKTLKHYIDHDGYHRVDIHGKHMKIHILVYLCWVGPIKQGLQINHKDDNKDNNYYKNLYAGTQKENVKDCKNNGHRKGHIVKHIVYDKQQNKILTFNSCKEFIDYTGHSQKNGSFNKCATRNWFKERFVLIA